MTLRPVDARDGQPQRVPFGIPRIKRIAIPASIIAAVGSLCWLAAQQRDPDRVSDDNHLTSMNSKGGNSPAPAKIEASEAVPHYAFSRFGLWVPANAILTPPVEAKAANTSSPSPQGQTASATTLQPADIDRDGGEKEDFPAGRRAEAGPLSNKAASAVKHRGRSRTKAYTRRVRPSEESTFQSVKAWVKAFFRRGLDQ